MPIVRNAVVLFSANTGMLTAGLADASRKIAAFSSGIERTTVGAARGFTTLQAAVVGTTLALTAAAGAVSVMGARFEQRMRNVNSLAQSSERQFKAMSDAVLELSTRFPQSADTLAEGLYDLVSSGLEGAEAIHVLEQAALSATAGLSDTETAAEALVAVINAFGLEASDAGRISDTLFQTVNYGIITFEELSNELGDVVGTAAAAGQSIEEVGAAMATMTLSGLGTDEAAVSLNRVLQAIIKPAGEMTHVLQLLGYESGAAALQQEGLYHVMREVQEVTNGNVTSLLRLFPEIRSSRGAMALLNNEASEYERVFTNMTDATISQGATQRAYQEQLKATTVQAQLFFETFRRELIDLGSLLLPIAQFALGDFPGPQILAGMRTFTSAMEALGGVLSDNRELIMVMGTVMAASMIPRLIMATRASASLARVWVGIKALEMGGVIRGAAGAFMRLHPALRVAAVAGTALASVWALVAKNKREAREEVELFTDALEADNGVVGENVRLEAARMLQESDAIEAAKRYGIELSTLTDAALGNVDAQRQLREELEKFAEEETQLLVGVTIAERTGFTTSDVNDVISEVLGIGSAFEQSVEEAEELAELVGDDLPGAVGEASDAVRALEAQMGSSAQEMAGDLGINLDQLEEMARRIQEVQKAVRQGLTRDTDVISQFDPMADLAAGASYEQRRREQYNNAVRGAEQAERSLTDARRQASQASRGVSDAERDLGQARANVGDVTRENAERLEDAYEAIEEAERRVTEAHDDAREAQEGLNEARVRAVELLEEQRQAVEDQAGEQEEGIIAVVRAQERLRELEAEGGGGIELRQARLALERARDGVRELQDAHEDEREELEKMTQAGVEGSGVVVQAREVLANAERNVVEAINAHSEAQQQLTETQEANSARLVEAHRTVERAEEGVADARYRVAQANQSVIDSTRDLLEAQGEVAAGALNMMSTSQRLAMFYEEASENAETFVEDVRKAVIAGLDPALAVELLEAGPEQAAPILEGLLSDHSGRMIELANEGEIRLEELTQSAVDTALALELAVGDAGDKMQEKLKTAMRIMSIVGRKGGEATTAEIARALRMGMKDISEISAEFGLNLASSLDIILEAVGEEPISGKIAAGLGASGSGQALYNPTPVPGGGLDAYESGGFVPGPNVRKDVVKALLTPREFVEPVDSVDYYGVDFMEGLRRRVIDRSAARGLMGAKRYQTGGLVTGDTEGLHPEFLRRLAMWAASVGTPYHVGSGYRSIQEQAVLYDRWLRRVPGQAKAAPPGRSNHNFGLASDGPRWGRRNPGAFGLRYPMDFEPWHVEPNEARAMRGTAGPMLSHTLFGAVMPALPDMPTGMVGDAATAVLKNIRDKAGEWASRNSFLSYDEETGSFSLFGGGVDASGFSEAVTRWVPQIQEALAMLGQAMAHTASVMAIIKHESGGNPGARNDWDINAQRGDPSRGLMQTIMSTFQAYRSPLLSDNIFDPLSNIYAGLNYGISRYGGIERIPGIRSLASGGAYRPYSSGGLVRKVMDSGGMIPRGWSLIGNFTGDLEAFGSSKDRQRFQEGGLVQLSNLFEGLVPTPQALQNIIENAILDSGLLGSPGVRPDATDQLISNLMAQRPQLQAPSTSGMGAGQTSAQLQQVINSINEVVDAYEEEVRQLEEIERLEQLREVRAARVSIVEATERDVEAAQRQVELLEANLQLAQTRVAGAETDEDRQAALQAEAGVMSDLSLATDYLAVLQDSLTDAQGQLTEATETLVDAEMQAIVAAEERAIAEELARLEQELRIATNRDQYEFEQMSTQQQLENVRLRLQAERRFSDEWMRLKDQEAQLIDQMQQEQARQLEQIQRDQDRLHQDLESQLDRVLDRYEDLNARAAELDKDFVERKEEMLRDVQLAIDRATRDADSALRDIIIRRVEAFSTAMPINQRFQEGWGNTVGALTRNVDAQIESFQEWSSTMAELRGKGLSEDVIAALGLEQIENMGDATMLLRASHSEIAQLNATYMNRQRLFSSQAETEQTRLLGAVGQATVEIRADLQDQMDQLWEAYLADLAEMEMQLEEQLREIQEEVAALGEETGRTYSERMAQALETGLPAVIALARQYEAALADAEAAAAALESLESAPPASSSTTTAPPLANNAPWWQGWSDRFASSFSYQTFDDGGRWPARTWGFNAGRSGDEYVFNSQQVKGAFRPVSVSPQITVVVQDGRLKDLISVEVDGQLMAGEKIRVLEGSAYG